jgi:hypothetical protein
LHGALEKWADQKFPLFEAREGFLGDAGVGEDHGDIRAMRFAEEIRPDFSFHDDDQGRMDRAESTAHRNDPVQREIEDSVGAWQPFAGQALAGFGGSGNENYRGGMTAFESVDQGLSG